MTKPLSILCVHGVGHGDQDPDLASSWSTAISNGLTSWDPALQGEVTCDFVMYDKLFEKAPLNSGSYAKAFAELLASGVVHGIGDFFSRERGLFELPEKVRWTAGMVAQWVSDEQLRSSARELILKKMQSKHYDIVCAHSLGSLLCYDTFLNQPAAIAGRYFVTFGSQIGNPCVRDTFAGRIAPLSKAAKWFHLYNPDDHVFTADIRLAADNFEEVGTQFDVPGDLLNHNPTCYLGHANTRAQVWRAVSGAKVARALTRSMDAFRSLARKPNRRALLIGINDYPDPANRLDGCVNDVFLMSSVLQECGFAPDDIRVVLNERATASGILERMHWLLEGVQSGDERVLFYSGHGAQMPVYGPTREADHMDECLVPWDFDWTPEHAVTDKQFLNLYSQLPYDSHFVAVFDCCHSGGMTREGARKARGITPPDDIRHRAMRWNAELQMWEDRPLVSPNPSLAARGADYLGSSGSCNRMCRAASLRANRKDSINPSFQQLVGEVQARLKQLKYAQTPNLVGPKSVLKQAVPWVRQAAVKGRRGKK